MIAPPEVPPTLPAGLPPDVNDQGGAAPRSATELFDQSWLGSVLRPLLVLILVGSFAAVLVTLFARFAPAQGRGFFVGLFALALIAALVGSITTTVLAQPRQRVNRSLGYRAAELGLFLALVRLFVWAAAGTRPALQAFVEHPLDTLLDPLFIFAALIVGLAWLYAVEMTDDFAQLALRADEFLHGRPRPGLADESHANAVDRQAVLASFTIRWVTLGLVLIVLAALLRRGLGWHGLFAMLRQDVEVTVLAPIILYFIAGLLLISYGRLALLRARWTLEMAPAQPAVARRWPWQVIALVGGVALLALLLPLGGTFVLATVLSAILSAIFGALFFLYRLAAYALLWLFSLFSGGEAPPPPAPPPATPAPIAAAPAAATPLLPPWFGGAVFWAIVALLVIYAAAVYLHDRGVRFAWLDWLWLMLRRRWGELRAAVRRGQARLARSGPAPAGALRIPWFARRRQWSDPDAHVRYLYLSTLHSADAAGLPRHPAETPLAYAPRLEQKLAEQEAAPAASLPVTGAADASTGASAGAEAAAMDALTDAFVELRYAGAHAGPAWVERLEPLWQALQDALRRRSERP